MSARPDDEDLLLDGRLRLRQHASGHRVGTDAILLSAMLADPGAQIVDAGAGVGAVGLALAQRSLHSSVSLVERDPEVAELARTNAALNGFDARVSVLECDLLDSASRRAAGLANESASAVYTNPPFYAEGSVRRSPDLARAAAHVLGPGGLDQWVRACLSLLAADGRFAMICLPDGLAEVLGACENRLGALRILPVHARLGEDARRILVSGRKGSRAPLAIAPGLALHEADGRFTPRAQALHRGHAILADV